MTSEELYAKYGNKPREGTDDEGACASYYQLTTKNTHHYYELFGQEFPNCCGSYILHGFLEGSNNYPNEQKQEFIDFLSWILLINQESSIVAILLKENQKETREILEELGFKVVNEFTNKNTERELQYLTLTR